MNDDVKALEVSALLLEVLYHEPSGLPPSEVVLLFLGCGVYQPAPYLGVLQDGGLIATVDASGAPVSPNDPACVACVLTDKARERLEAGLPGGDPNMN